MTKHWLNLSLLSLFSLLFLNGCWDLKELKDISVITGMAIDKGDDLPLKLTLETVIASELNPKTGGKTTPSVTLTLEGHTVAELAHKVNVGFSNRPEYSHMKTLVISEDVAREGITHFLDFMDRNREIRNDFNILVARGVKASDVLKVTYPEQKVSTMKVSPQLEHMVAEWGGDPDVRMRDVLADLLSQGKEPVMAAVAIEGDKEKGKSTDNMKSIDLPAMVKLTSLAVFKRGKLVGYVPIEDTRNYMWVQDKIKHTSINIPCKKVPNGLNVKQAKATLRIASSDTNVKVDYMDGKPYISVDISSVARLEGTQCSDDINSLKTYEYLDEESGTYIEESIKKTIRKLQTEFDSDIFGFGNDLYREHPQKFEKVADHWDDEFAKAEVNVKATVSVKRTGLKSNTFQDMPDSKGE